MRPSPTLIFPRLSLLSRGAHTPSLGTAYKGTVPRKTAMTLDGVIGGRWLEEEVEEGIKAHDQGKKWKGPQGGWMPGWSREWWSLTKKKEDVDEAIKIAFTRSTTTTIAAAADKHIQADTSAPSQAHAQAHSLHPTQNSTQNLTRVQAQAMAYSSTPTSTSTFAPPTQSLTASQPKMTSTNPIGTPTPAVVGANTPVVRPAPGGIHIPSGLGTSTAAASALGISSVTGSTTQAGGVPGATVAWTEYLSMVF